VDSLPRRTALRRGGPPDAEAVADLYLRARRAALAAKTIPPLVHSDTDVRRWVTEVLIVDCETWLAEVTGEGVVAFLALQGDWIDQLYVAPRFTGRGIGGQLLEMAKRERPDGLRLWTFASNLGAQRFYARHGFIEVQRTDGSGNEERSPDIQYAYRWAQPPTVAD
jgi:GNAT superfamily N-acetyltransferase